MTPPDPRRSGKQPRAHRPLSTGSRLAASPRSLLSASLCALLLGLLTAGCGTTRAARPTDASSASALDTPTDSPTGSSPTPPSASPNPAWAGPCLAANLTADPVTGIPMGMTQTVYRIRLVNHGPACRLRGYPQHLAGLALIGTTQQVNTHPATADDITSMTSGKPADLATGDAADFVLHTAHGCDSDQVGPSKSESYTRLWFSLAGQPGRVTVVAQDNGPGVDSIGLPRCFTSMTRFYADLPTAGSSGGPTPPEPSPTPDPTGILDDPEAPASPSDFVSGNRWHGTIAGQDVNVYAGSAGITRMDTGKVIVQFDQPGKPTQTFNDLSPHSGPLMIVAIHYKTRLTLWDSHGYRHTLILAGPKTLEYRERGPRVAIPADSLGPAAPCDHDLHHLVTVAAGPDTPYPRCMAVFSDQALRVQNHTGLYGQQPHPITVRFPTLPTTTLQPGQSTVFPNPFTRLAPGAHRLHLGYYNADIWVR